MANSELTIIGFAVALFFPPFHPLNQLALKTTRNGEGTTPRPADVLEMRALLRLPGLSAPERKTLWTSWRDLAGKLAKEATAREASAAVLPAANETRALGEETYRALYRAEASLGLLRLAGSPDAQKVETEQKRVEVTPTDEALWAALRRELRQAWKRQETATLRP